MYAKPQYSKFGAVGTKAGDWLVDDRNGNRLLVELGIIHDGTDPKSWSQKCDGDRQKLMSVADQIPGLHLILVTTLLHDEIATADEWVRRWSRLQCWNLDTSLKFSLPLPDAGQMVLRGWLISDCCDAAH